MSIASLLLYSCLLRAARRRALPARCAALIYHARAVRDALAPEPTRLYASRRSADDLLASASRRR
jgi:hypothetical protein